MREPISHLEMGFSFFLHSVLRAGGHCLESGAKPIFLSWTHEACRAQLRDSRRVISRESRAGSQRENAKRDPDP